MQDKELKRLLKDFEDEDLINLDYKVSGEVENCLRFNINIKNWGFTFTFFNKNYLVKLEDIEIAIKEELKERDL